MRNPFTKRAPAWALIAFFAFAFASCSAKYGTLGSGDTDVPLPKELRKGTLENGLTYYLFENKKPENRAYLRLAVNAGSVEEADGQEGIAHFTEHMAFEDTRHFQSLEIVNYLRSLGMEFGPDVNAYTSYDSTVYDIVVPTEKDDEGKKIIPDKALSILDDWAGGVLFNEKGVDKERKIILEEIRTRANYWERRARVLYPLLYEGSKYAERRPIGKVEVVENATPSGIDAFYKKWYRPDNMAVIITGDFDSASLEKHLNDVFTVNENDTPRDSESENDGEDFYPLPPPEAGKIRAKVFKDSEATRTQISIFYKQFWEPENQSLKTYRDYLIDNIISGIVSERFYDEEHKTETPYMNAGLGRGRFSKSSMFAYIGADSKAGQFKEALKALLEIKESVSRYGFLKGEFERAKKDILSSCERNYNEKEKINSSAYLDSFSDNFLMNSNASSVEWDLKAVKEMLPRISLDDLRETAKKYFEIDDVLIFIGTNPEEESVLSEDEIIAMFEEVKTAEITPPAENAVKSELVKELGAKGSIVSEETDGNDITHLVLSNGSNVFLKNTENKNDQIILSACARGGVTSAGESDRSDIVSSELASEIFAASGLGDFTAPELGKTLAGKNVSISFSAGDWSRGINGSSTKGDIKTLFELLYLTFRAPRMDADALDSLKEKYKTLLLKRADNPETYFYDEYTKILYNNNPYMTPLTVPDIDLINLEKAKSFITRSLNPADWTFVFTGNIERKTIDRLLETYLASVPRYPDGTEPFNSFSDIKIDFARQKDVSLYKGIEDRSIVYIGHSFSRAFDFKTALEADLLTKYFDIVLNDEIREKLGGVYGISAGADLSVVPPGAECSGFIYFICESRRVEELSAASEAEFIKAAAGDIDDSILEKARLACVKENEDALQSNSYIAGRIASYSVMLNIPLSSIYEKEAIYNSIKKESLADITKQLLASGLVRVALYPEKDKRK